MSTLARSSALALAAALLAACTSAYYGAMERVGVEKRDILADRVAAGREDQREAQEQFESAFAQFKAMTGFEGGDLEALYDELDAEFRRSESRAEDVREQIRSIERVASDLFAEWEDELDEISSADLRSRSRGKLGDTRARYERLIAAMRRAERSMDPVLTAFRDQVLFLKHNLNASAIASLEGSVGSIESDVEQLIREMQASIREADAFLSALET